MKIKVLSGKFIRIRDKAYISGMPKGEILANEEFFANSVGLPTENEHWVQVTEGKFAGFFGAIVYNGQTFAEVLSNDPVPPSDEFAPALIVQPEGSTQKARYVFDRIIE